MYTPKWKALAAALTVVVVAALASAIPTAANAASWIDQIPRDQWPETVTADALPTVQIGAGVVWSVEVNGDIAYAAGEFSTARPAGAAVGVGEVPRKNFLAFNVATGQLLPFAPTFNAAVKDMAVTPDGSKLVVVGNFTQVDGLRRDRIAVFDLATGQLAALARTPDLNGPASTVAVTNSIAYVGGYFSAVNGETSARLGAVRLTNGNIVTGFRARFTDANGVRQPTIPDNQVLALTVNADGTRVAAAGNFTRAAFTTGGVTSYPVSTGRDGTSQGYGIAMFDTADASRALPMPANTQVRNAGDNAWLFSLDSDGTNLYGTGGHWGSSGTIEGSFAIRWSDNDVAWIDDCHGDTYDISSIGDTVYSASHKHYCANSGGFPQVDSGWTYYHSTAWTKRAAGLNTPDRYGYPDHPGTPHPQLLYWFPYTPAGSYTGKNQATWTVAGNSEYVVYGGEFTSVNGAAQQGLVRYTVRSKAPNKQGPRPSQEQEREAHDANQSFGAWWAPKLQTTIPGALRVSYPTVFDRDDTKLTYRVYLDTENAAGLIDETTVDRPFWEYQTLRATASNLAPGSTHQVRVTVSDPSGNVFKSDWSQATVASGTASAYMRDLARDDVTHLWRLGEPSGPSVDVFGNSALNLSGRLGRGAAGALAGDADGSTEFNNSSSASQNTGVGYSTVREAGASTFSLETWFRTTTTSGGKLIGFGSSQTGNSGSYDRQIYMNDAGQLYFGVYPNQVRTVNTTDSYRDGAWHHVVATLGADGMRLYVDGRLKAQRTDTTSAQAYDGYWRVGGDNLGGWPAAPSSTQFEGTLDEVAVYGSALPADRVASHFTSGSTGAAANVPPTASIAPPAVTGLRADFAGSGTDSDGTIVSYDWDFGDGSTATGANASRTYERAGTFTVTLTVTDDRGATASASTEVAVAAAPNQAPSAVIAAPVITDARVALDGSGSTDPDGGIVSYTWQFGDGTSASGATVEKTYATSGTYTVRLTVVDGAGATGTVTRDVAVTVPVRGVLAQDGFDRALVGSWGQADRGGSWTLRGGTGRFSVADGVGRITLPANQALTAYADLNDVTATSTKLQAVWSVDKLVESQYVGLIGRRVGAANDFYAARLRLQADGGVRLNLMLGTGTSLGSVQLPTSIVPGQKYLTAVQVTGTTTVDIKAKVWREGDPEPGWQLERTSTPPSVLASGGSPSVFSYGPSVAGGPGIVSFDSVVVSDPSVSP